MRVHKSLAPFKAKSLNIERKPHWMPGMPTHDAHECPACGKWEMFDVISGLCQSCHGAVRAIKLARRVR